MEQSLKNFKRTHMCGHLDQKDINEHVTVMGWIQRRRDLGGLIFIDLRDRAGIVQVVFDAKKCGKYFDEAEKLRNEYVVAIKGQVVKRAPETVNPKISTGYIEIVAMELIILSTSKTPPFMIEDETKVSEAIRLKYRYLDLRRPKMQQNLILRHNVCRWIREFLNNEDFLEIETPMLTRSTPEGARDYLVPSRVHPGSFYALPQSPQLFKQLLMLSGYDRYYQITRCFRDEDLRADRQPEFTQVDIEMSFVDMDNVMDVNERMIAEIFKRALDVNIKLPLPQISYEEAMNRYGSDKPDTRFGLELKDVSDIVKDSDFRVFTGAIERGGSVRAINANGCGAKFSRREIDGLVDYVKEYGAKGLAWIVVEETELKSPIVKFFDDEILDKLLERLEAKPGDLLLFVADKNEVVFHALGELRLELGRRLKLLDDSTYNLLWVTEFPLFEYSEDEKRYVAKHHPFTAPMDEDLKYLENKPEKVRSKAYDMVLNGVEIGGGSIRIHDSKLQERMLKALGFTKEQSWERFGFLLQAFQYGAPPHGGIAYGLDRLVMLLAGEASIREVIAFPKVQNASDLMTEAPSPVDSKQLKELNIDIDI